MKVVRFDGGPHPFRIDAAVLSRGQGTRRYPPKNRRTSRLVAIDVIGVAGDVFLAALAVAQQCQKIGLGGTGAEKPRFLAEQRGAPRFQSPHRRVAP